MVPGAPANARENAYDVLAKALMPFVQVFAKKAKGANRAVSMELRLESMTDLPEGMADAKAELALEAPDKLRVRAPILGEALTIARDGQKLWVAPGDKAAALMALAESQHQLPSADKKFKLEPFRLPVPEKQLVFFPVLFQVRDAGDDVVDADPCRLLDVQLMPELARSLGVTGWSARLWVRADGRPARVTVSREGWAVQVRIEALTFAPSLPEETWAPAEGENALPITPARYKQLLDAITGGGEKRKKDER